MVNGLMKLIAAITLNNCIGKEGKLVFPIKEDLKRFKELTTNNIVIYGGRTFREDLGERALNNRVNIVVTTRVDKLTHLFNEPNLYFAKDPYQAAELAYKLKGDANQSIWIAGGSSIYSRFLSPFDFKDGKPLDHLLHEMYITHIHKVCYGDRYLHLDWSKWNVVEEEQHEGYSFVKYIKL